MRLVGSIEGICSSMPVAHEYIAKRTVHLLAVEPNSKEPMVFGSGCIINYKGKKFILSAEHVTNDNGYAATIELGIQEDLTSGLWSTGGFIYYDQLVVDPKVLATEREFFEKLEMNSERLDASFSSSVPPSAIIQHDWTAHGINVNRGVKKVIADSLVATPNVKESYSLCGYVDNRIQGIHLLRRPVLHQGLKYEQTIGRYHLLKAPKVIESEKEYEGCSGAPVFDTMGKFIGVLSSVNAGTQMVFVYDAAHILQLIDYAVDADQV